MSQKMQNIELPKYTSCNHYFGSLLVFRKLFFFNIHIKTIQAPPLPSIYPLYLMGQST